MHLCLASAATFFSYCMICFFCLHHIIDSAANDQTPDFLEDVAINCGSPSHSTSFHGREWIAETQALEPKGKSTSSRIAIDTPFFPDPIPYMTARISSAQFSYTFQVNPGQKFIRFHFHPSSYQGFEQFHDFFSVKVGHFTLLKNFSASLVADVLGVNYLVKEFCLNVVENEKLNIAFSPYQSNKLRKIYAFVNGIEIISMPTGLYYTPDGDLGAPIVGEKDQFFCIDNSTALEMVQRLNIGGSSISPIEDFGMFRSWGEDANYLMTSKLQPVNNLVRGVKFTSITAFIAPFKIYQTSWRTKTRRANKMHDFTWKVPVDIGFAYLVRLHFFNFELEMTEGGQRAFSILINNQTAENNIDIISLSGEIGVPIYRDYVIMVKREKEAGKGDLFIALRSSDELAIGLLHGLEILKLSGLGDNLASPNTLSFEQVSAFWNIKIQKQPLALGKKNVIMTCMTILIIFLNIIVFKLREVWEEISHEDKTTQPASGRQSFRRFKLQEIVSATQDFSNEFLIGKGGFGVVYKGFIQGSSEIVAVKRLKSNSKQGAREFWAEIETLSKIRHIHLVSLIGYCNEYREMILVYEYMPRGTLADNLYKIGKNGNDGTPLTWEQRLKICIGAARGLDYLHTGIKYAVIHRDVKVSNILLDENLVAKISDFGLSKPGRLSESQSYVSTKVKGTYGYLDPEYIMTHKATRKTDVYSFGVVMLVVLSGRRAIDTSVPWDPQSLVSIFRECLMKGDFSDIIDPSLQGNFSSGSFREFIKSAEKCLDPLPKKRPTMFQLVTSLEYTLEDQQSPDTESSQSEAAVISGDSLQPSDDGMAIKSNETGVSPVHEESSVSSSIEDGNRRVDFESTRKPLWFWRWGALGIGKKRKSKKKYVPPEDLSSGDHPDKKDTHMSESTDDPQRTGELEFFDRNRSVFNLDDLLEASAEVIGRGVGVTYKVVVGCGPTVAVKRFKVMSDLRKEEISPQIQLLGKLKHENLVEIISYYCGNWETLLICEYVPHGNLYQLLHEFRGTGRPPADWRTRLSIIKDIAKGLNFLHQSLPSHKVPHGNLKSSNVLLHRNSQGYHSKLSDYGFLSFRPFGKSSENLAVSKLPEFRKGKKVTEKADIFCFGIVLLEIITGKSSVHTDLSNWIRTVVHNDWLPGIIDTEIAAEREGYDDMLKLTKIALECTDIAPEKRPKMSEVLRRIEEIDIKHAR